MIFASGSTSLELILPSRIQSTDNIFIKSSYEFVNLYKVYLCNRDMNT